MRLDSLEDGAVFRAILLWSTSIFPPVKSLAKSNRARTVTAANHYGTQTL
jgi:hypothetical protein